MRRPERPDAVVVGAGLMGRWHAAAAARAGARVAVIVDADAARASDLARRFSGSTAQTELGPALAGRRGAMVHLCTPTGTHEAMARAAIGAGCHVLVEKPLAPTAAATGALLEAAARKGVLLCPCHQFLFQRGVARAFARLPRLGAVRHVEAVICSAGAEGADAAGRDQVALDVLPHPLSLLARLLSAATVSGLRWQVLHGGAGEIRASAAAGGTTAAIAVSMGARPTQNVLRVLADGGSIHCDLFHGFAVAEPGTVSRARKIVHPFATGTATMLAAGGNLVRRAVRGESAYPGLRELVDLCYRSAADGRPSPVAPEETLAVAAARDAIAAALARRPSSP